MIYPEKPNLSPYRYWPGDQKVIRCSNGGKRSPGKEEQLVLHIVHRCAAVTPGLLHRQMQIYHKEHAVSEQRLRILLGNLVHSGYLVKFVSEDPEANSQTLIYTLSALGISYFSGPRRKISILHCKRLLAAQQYLFCSREHPRSEITMDLMVSEQNTQAGYFGVQFHCDAFVREEDGRTVFVLAVRSCDAADTLAEHLHTMEAAIFSPAHLNVQTKDSRVILVCEDPAHEHQVQETLLAMEASYEFPLYLTNDLALYHDTGEGLTKYPLRKDLSKQLADRLSRIFETALP